jgi:hypothetical protein
LIQSQLVNRDVVLVSLEELSSLGHELGAVRLGLVAGRRTCPRTSPA